MEKLKQIKTVARRPRKRDIGSDVIRYVDHSMSIAKQINEYLREMEIDQRTLAEKMGKKDSEISKWLRGTHNFTLKTISKLEVFFNKQIVLCPREIPKNEYQLLVFRETKQVIKVKPHAKDAFWNSGNYSFTVSAGSGTVPSDCQLIEQ